jgi:hypothetical protein
MTTSLNALVANEHVADLRRAAEHRRFEKPLPSAARSARAVAPRQAQADDARALRLLAELDEEPELAGNALLALVDGEAVAALSLEDGRVVANPFVATSDAVALLKLRARHVIGRRVRRPHRRWRPRFA